MSLKFDHSSFFSGLLFFLLGGSFTLFSWINYPLGSTSNMGPGFFPFWLGLLLTILGLFTFLYSFKQPIKESLPRLHWQPVFWISLAIIVFILSIEHLGLFIAILLLIFLCHQVDKNYQLHHTLILAVLAAIFSILVFVKGLGVLLPIFPQ